MPRKPPGARERGIGAELRSIREGTGQSVTAVAAHLGWSKSLLSNLENGKRNIEPEEVASLLTIYGVTDGRRDDLIGRARAGDEPGWWERTLPGVPRESGTLASYEAEASEITNWSPGIVPGLLQTMDYTRAYMIDDGIDPSDVEVRLMARLRRQQALAGPIKYTAIIGEAALRTPFGGLAVMAAQLQAILRAVEAPNVHLHVVPEHVPHAGLLGAFMLLTFPVARPVAHVELLRSAVFLDRDDAPPYVDAVARLRAVSMGATESTQLIATVAEEMRRDGGVA
ncbi:MAG TPA: helix-turn-helix transcriptional regulator [Actinokineospora sp.]|jgi:transcriptional regulator with XRE-family HTH domain|nr:helix-turn-helix transcriptional regulator [Actinokineospora sp.]